MSISILPSKDLQILEVTFPGSFYSGMQKIRVIDVIAQTLPSRPWEQND